MENFDEAINYFFRYCNDDLTKEEQKTESIIEEQNKHREWTDNAYASCGQYKDVLKLSLDTH